MKCLNSFVAFWCHFMPTGLFFPAELQIIPGMDIFKSFIIFHGLVVKNPPANAGDRRDVGSIPGSGRSPRGGNGNTHQYSCLENPMDRRSLAGYRLDSFVASWCHFMPIGLFFPTELQIIPGMDICMSFIVFHNTQNMYAHSRH